MKRTLEEIANSDPGTWSEEEGEIFSEHFQKQIRSVLRPEPDRARQIYREWAKKDYWTNVEAAVLSIGMNPILRLIQYMERDDAGEFHKRLDLIDRKFGGRVEPAALSDWSHEKGIAIHEGVLNAISEQKKPPHQRPQDEERREHTADKMLLAMAVGKYGYTKKKTENDVADSIMRDFEQLDTGQTLAKNTIISRLKRALEKYPPRREKS